jgi:hypothetical protein
MTGEVIELGVRRDVRLRRPLPPLVEPAVNAIAIAGRARALIAEGNGIDRRRRTVKELDVLLWVIEDALRRGIVDALAKADAP